MTLWWKEQDGKKEPWGQGQGGERLSEKKEKNDSTKKKKQTQEEGYQRAGPAAAPCRSRQQCCLFAGQKGQRP